jgi:uncharacterized protein YbaP (TraB family)
MMRLQTPPRPACNSLAALLLVALAACGSAKPPTAASAPKSRSGRFRTTPGVHGWLLGTVHSLPRGTQWRRPAIDGAISEADRLVLEIGERAQSAGRRRSARASSRSRPICRHRAKRVGPKFRGDMAKVFKDLSLNDAQFKDQESWAVALQIAAIGGLKQGMEPDSGVEPELRKVIGAKPITRPGDHRQPVRHLRRACRRARRPCCWSKWHMRPLTTATTTRTCWRSGCAAMSWASRTRRRPAFWPTRNCAPRCSPGATWRWADKINAMLKAGAKPFIAVGAAHVAGVDGLPAPARSARVAGEAGL